MKWKIGPTGLCLWLLVFVDTLAAKELNIVPFDEENLGLDQESISLATGVKTPVAVSPAVATVITREEIQNFGYRTIVEAIGHVPGIHVGRRAFGLEPIFSVRGFTSPHTLLWLIDGEPFPRTIVGNLDVSLSRIPIGSVERIELMRGPSSAAHGNEAFLGVVNIITRKFIEGTEIRAEGGTFDDYTVQAITGFKINQADVTLDLDAHSIKGYEPFVQSDLQTSLDQNFGTNASLAPGFGNTGDKSFGISSNISNGDRLLAIRVGANEGKEPGIGFLPVLSDGGEVNTSYYALRYEFPIINANAYSLKGSLGINHRDFELKDLQYFPSGAFGGAFADGLVATLRTKETYLAGRLFGVVNKLRNNQITYALQVRNSDVRISDFAANYMIDPIVGLVPDPVGNNVVEGNSEKNTTYTLRLNDEFGIFKSITGSIGFNADYDDKYEWIVSPRGALIWNISNDITIKALVGEGVRIPTISETLDSSVPVVVANPELKPESITSYDLVFDYSKNNHFGIRANLFYHKTKDQINQTNATNGAVIPQNVGLQRGEGVEIEVKYRPTQEVGFSIFGHYQENRGGFSTTDEEADIGYSPHVKGGIKLRYSKKRVTVGTTYVYTGDRDRPATDQKGEADKYGLLGISASYTISDNVSLQLKIENALDEKAQEANLNASANFDIDLPGRSTHLIIKAKF